MIILKSFYNNDIFWTFNRFSSAWLCQQSSWNRNLSVARRLSVRPSVVRVAIISEPNARISFKQDSIVLIHMVNNKTLLP